MGCCKCEKYEWPDPQEVVWVNPSDNKEYCVYHAPKDKKFESDGKKLCSANDFEKNIERRIRDAVKLDKECVLRGSIFPHKLHFGKIFQKVCPCSVSFHDATFCGDVNFFEVHFRNQTDFSQAKFLSDVDFTETKFEARAEFFETEFYGNVKFYKTKFNSGATFFNNTSRKEITFFFCKAEQREIKICNFCKNSISCLSFTPVDIKHFLFVDCKWPKRLGLETRSSNYTLNEELYRAMKQRAAEEHDQSQVSHWHFREKLMFKKQRWYRRWLPVTLTWWYWATSGFGERAVRAFVFLVVLLLLPFLANSVATAWIPSLWAKVPGTQWLASTVSTIGDAVNATAAMHYIPFTKDIGGEGASGWRKVGQGLWQCLIILQFTLFALAVRNRFRR
jgi:hypothetical protein